MILATLLGVCALIAVTTALLLRDDPADGAASVGPADRARVDRLAPELAAIAPPWMSEAERRDWIAARARDTG